MVGIIFLVIVLIFALAFSAQNAHPVTIDFFFGRYEAPLAFIMVITLVAGFLLGVLAMVAPVLKLKFENSALKKEVKTRGSDIERSSKLPTADVNAP